jgi:hypothetical protein
VSPALSAEDLAALLSAFSEHGRGYKTFIRSLWEGAVIPLGCPNTDRDTVLYCLRNTHGPSWLSSFRMTPKSHARNPRRRNGRNVRWAELASEPCAGVMQNGPDKRYARCSSCAAIDYEKNEGDRCGRPRPVTRKVP